MKLAARLPLLPAGAITVSDSLAIHIDDGRVVFFNGAGPIFTCDAKDRVGVRLGAVSAVREGLAGVGEVAAALGLHRTTLFRDRQRFEAEGVKGLLPRPRGPRVPHKLTPALARKAQRALDEGTSITATAEGVGLSYSCIQGALARGQLTRAWEARVPETAAATVPGRDAGPNHRAAIDQSCDAGVAVKRTTERALARAGLLTEAQPHMETAHAVAGAGVLLALPALEEQGLVDVGQQVYGSLGKGFFGLRSVLLTFAFMALLRIRTPERLGERSPGEFGLLLGLDRAPEVKTLRRKLREMGERGLARDLGTKLSERWAKATPRELAVLYVDGHVRPYHGRKHSLPKRHVQQRGRPMPGTMDFHVNDRRADPLLSVTATGTEGMMITLDRDLLPRVRELIGPTRRVTVAFDREGWSPKLFATWKAQGFDVLTYRKGEQTRWQSRFFGTVKGRVGGARIEHRLAEREVRLTNGLRVREVRRLTDDGRQTAIITTNKTMTTLQVAHRMFSRWRQENFFRYMRHEFALDHLCTYQMEPADPQRQVIPPERKRLKKRLIGARDKRMRLMDRRLDLKPGERARVGNRRLGEDELDELISKLDDEVVKTEAQLALIPKKVAVATLMPLDKIVQQERERKMLVDSVKLTAYRAESALARLVEPFFERHEDEARKLLRTIFQATADVLPDEEERVLTVRFHGLATRRATRALAALCDLMTAREATYPGTALRLRFEAPTLHE